MLEPFILLLKEMFFFVGYLNNPSFQQTLTESEQEYYISKLNDKDYHDKAREKLIIHNLRLVAHIAKKYDNLPISQDDLISIGTIGLIKAVDSYSVNKGKKLVTYASKCIENEILMYIRTNKKNLSTLSLFDSLGQDDEGQEIKIEDVVYDEMIDYEEKIDNETNINVLLKYLDILDDMELSIISMRYGLNNQKELTQKEIGKKLNISRSYVSRIEKKALNKLLFALKKDNYFKS